VGPASMRHHCATTGAKADGSRRLEVITGVGCRRWTLDEEARIVAESLAPAATAKLNGVEPQARLTDVLERLVSGRTKARELEDLLPWAWKAARLTAAVEA
jgi:IS66 C-terminal element